MGWLGVAGAGGRLLGPVIAMRTLALAACDALAALTEGPSLAMATAPSPAPDRDPIDALLGALPEAIRAALGSAALPNPEAWEQREVSEMMRTTRGASVVGIARARNCARARAETPGPGRL